MSEDIALKQKPDQLIIVLTESLILQSLQFHKEISLGWLDKTDNMTMNFPKLWGEFSVLSDALF